MMRPLTTVGIATPITSCPFSTFDVWFTAAKEHEPIWPQAMNLATISCVTGRPSSRTVLLQQWSPEDRCFRFYSNFQSAKGRDIAANSNVALHFYWRTLGRQVRIEGTAMQASSAVSDAYFNSRPRGHKISAWASSQSDSICDANAGAEDGFDGAVGFSESDDIMKKRVEEVETRFGTDDAVIPRPEWCGVFEVSPTFFEFWEEGAERRHRRVVFDAAPPPHHHDVPQKETAELEEAASGPQRHLNHPSRWVMRHVFP
mmetsp:Transcript_80092/g.93555  ORF Transcript_80092/g.93555 Transcript_80092/m.93555 type:complete len:258 (+) Transcript_80092:31-804(+)